ncbi:hypothetical protein MTR67_042748, partial [Solanum verrucosum]
NKGRAKKANTWNIYLSHFFPCRNLMLKFCNAEILREWMTWLFHGPVRDWPLVSPLVYVVFGICRCFLFAVCLLDKLYKVMLYGIWIYIHLRHMVMWALVMGEVIPKDVTQHVK